MTQTHKGTKGKILDLGLESVKDQMADAYVRGMDPEQIWAKYSKWAGVSEDYLKRKVPMRVIRLHIRENVENT